jgi:RNA polymerase sigma factor (sigma-70 family)
MILTPASPPGDVHQVAAYLACRAYAVGALERSDLIQEACLAFYRAAPRWQGSGSFGSYIERCMRGAISEALRAQARHEGWVRKPSAEPVVQGFASSPKTRTPPAGGGSASQPSPQPTVRHRRRASRRLHNQTYYLRRVGLQACEVCGTLVERGHGARRCAAHMTAGAIRVRAYRLRKAQLRQAQAQAAA